MKYFVKGLLYGGLLNYRVMVMCNILVILFEVCFIYEIFVFFVRSKLYISLISIFFFNVLNVVFENFSNFGFVVFGGR